MSGPSLRLAPTLALAGAGGLAAGARRAPRVGAPRIGRYAEIPYGIRPDHPFATRARRRAMSDGAVVAIDPSGRVRSRTKLGSRHYEGAALAIGRDGGVQVPTLTEGLVGPGGSERWRAANGAGYRAGATLDEEDTALIIDGGGQLRAIAADGTERWRVGLGSYSYESPLRRGRHPLRHHRPGRPAGLATHSAAAREMATREEGLAQDASASVRGIRRPPLDERGRDDAGDGGRR